MLDKLNNWYQSVKDWFKRSEVIFLARVEAAGGFLLGALDGIDWSAFTTLDWGSVVSNKSVLITAAAMFFHGLVLEVARRRNSDL